MREVWAYVCIYVYGMAFPWATDFLVHTTTQSSVASLVCPTLPCSTSMQTSVLLWFCSSSRFNQHANHCFSLSFLVVLTQPAWKPLFFLGFSGFPGFSEPMAVMAPVHKLRKTRNNMQTIVFLWFFWSFWFNYHGNHCFPQVVQVFLVFQSLWQPWCPP